MSASRFCRCERPSRAVDRDGVAYCEACGELLHDGRDELIAALIKRIDTLSKKVDALTEREGPPARASGRLTAKEKALELGVTVDYVYRHKVELGGEHLPSAGGQGRLRFPAGAPAPAPSPPPARAPRRKTSANGASLLPIKGEG